jgi:hypothetical protein
MDAEPLPPDAGYNILEGLCGYRFASMLLNDEFENGMIKRGEGAGFSATNRWTRSKVQIKDWDPASFRGARTNNLKAMPQKLDFHPSSCTFEISGKNSFFQFADE